MLTLPEFELLFDLIYQDYLVPVDPIRFAQSALFLSSKYELASPSSYFYDLVLLN